MSGSNLNGIVREAAQHMNYFCEIFKFHQLNKNLSSRGNILDLVLSNKKIVNVNTGLLKDCDRSHFPLEINIKINYCKFSSDKIKYRIGVNFRTY